MLLDQWLTESVHEALHVGTLRDDSSCSRYRQSLSRSISVPFHAEANCLMKGNCEA
jgi:hypothetical protein